MSDAERPSGAHRMTREEFIERMQRDAIRRVRGEDPASAEERAQQAEREEREKQKKRETELSAYKLGIISKYMHKLHRQDTKARINGFH